MNSHHFRQSGAVESRLGDECVEHNSERKVAREWDTALGPHLGEHGCTAPLPSAFPDASTRRVKMAPAWGTEELSVQEAALPVPKAPGDGGGEQLS